MEKPVYPFVAIVNQEKMKLALVLNVINPTLSGVLIRGEKGTGKSTAVRALADILPEIEVVKDCPFQLAPDDKAICSECFKVDCRSKRMSGEDVPVIKRKIRVVELPVGATEDRVVGTIDLEVALQKGEKQIEPGILAAAHRGILYVDEVNLLDDHVVDVLLDSAAMGINVIEREGISFSHPAKFTLVGTMNPEEGELRPQLLDRFGLCVHIEGVKDPVERVKIMERRADFDENPDGFIARWMEESRKLTEKIQQAISLYSEVVISRELMLKIAEYCVNLGVDGHRGDIIMLKAAKTIAAYDGRKEVMLEDVNTAAELVLPHRLRRKPMEEIASSVNYLFGSE